MSRRTSIAGAAAVVVVTVGAAVLAAWVFHLTWFEPLRPGQGTMKANTGLGFVLAGSALWWRRQPGHSSPVATACAIALGAVAVATLSEYAVGWDLRLDQLLAHDPAHHRGPGRMSVATASCFVLIAGSLLTIDAAHRRWRWASRALALVAGTVALTAAVGYLYGARILYGGSAYASIAVHTCLTLLVLVVGVLFARPDRDVMRAVTDDDALAARLARRILPAVIVLPIVMGWVRLEGQRHGLFGLEVGLALFALSNVVLLSAVVWSSAARHLRLELANREALATGRASELAQQADQHFLSELADGLRGLRSESAVLADSATRVAGHLGLSRCLLAEIDLVAGTLNVREAFTDGVRDLRGTIPLATGGQATVTALRAGEVVVNDDTVTDPRTRARYDSDYGPLGLRAYIAVPVMVDGSLAAMFLGAVVVPRPWQAREVTVMQSAADRAWGRISEIRLLRQQESLLAQLLDLNHTLEARVEQRTADLGAALAEREVLLQEVHHRVKNNLQVISSLMNMQVRTLPAGPGQRALQECRTRVEAIALIHEKLYQAQDYADVPFSDYARSLAANVVRAVGTVSGAIVLKVEIEELHLSVDRAIPCGLILNELLVNCFKHAFAEGQAGTITVQMSAGDGRRVRLRVADDGRGAPDGRGLPGTASLGMRLVTTLARQLRGEVAIVTSPGFAVTIEFPLGEEVRA